MKEDLSNYPEKFVYRIAKSLKADGFDFKPYYDHHFQDNLPIVEEASSLYGIDIPEDFFVELYRLNGEESMFEKGYDINNLRYPTLEKFYITIGVSHDVVITREYKVPTKSFDLIVNAQGEPKTYYSDEDFNEVYLSTVKEIGIDESVQKRKTKLESLNRDQLLRLRGLIDEQLKR